MTAAAAREAPGYWRHYAFVASDNEPGVEYEVKRHTDGRLGCSCLSYRFAHGAKTCKHLRALDAADECLGRSPSSETPREIYRPRVGTETFTVRRAITFRDVEP